MSVLYFKVSCPQIFLICAWCECHELPISCPHIFHQLGFVSNQFFEHRCKIGSWGSEATPYVTHSFKRSYKISHSPGLKVSWDALPSFASSSQSVKIGLSEWIFYVKNHPHLFDFFSMKNNRLGPHFLLRWFFANFNFKKKLCY